MVFNYEAWNYQKWQVKRYQTFFALQCYKNAKKEISFENLWIYLYVLHEQSNSSVAYRVSISRPSMVAPKHLFALYVSSGGQVLVFSALRLLSLHSDVSAPRACSRLPMRVSVAACQFYAPYFRPPHSVSVPYNAPCPATHSWW